MSGVRVLVVAYVPLFFLGAAIGDTIGQDVLRGLPLVPVGIYVVLRVATAVLTGRAVVWRSGPGTVMKVLLLSYAVLYGLLFFPRAFPGLVGMASTPILFIHVAFWILVYSDATYQGRSRLFGQDLVTGIGIGFLTGFVLTLQAAGWNVRPGAIHNLSGTNLVRSDADVPILITTLMLIGVGVVIADRRDRIRGGWYHWRFTAVAGVTMALTALAVFYLYSRRTPVLAAMAGIMAMMLPIAFQRRLVYATPLLALVPFVWDVVGRILILLTQNPVMNALLARNLPEHYLTATYRLTSWQAAIRFMTDVRPQHLWGYGGVEVIAADLQQEHTHNVLLQLFFEAGLMTVAIATLLLVIVFGGLGTLLIHQETRREGTVMMGLLVAWLVLGAVEPTLRQYSIGHLLFLTLAAYVANSLATPVPSPAPETA